MLHLITLSSTLKTEYLNSLLGQFRAGNRTSLLLRFSCTIFRNYGSDLNVSLGATVCSIDAWKRLLCRGFIVFYFL